MYEELVKRLIEDKSWLEQGHLETEFEIAGHIKQAANAIEERDRYALTLQHEMMAEAESHIALVERLNKQVAELQMQVAHWQRELAKSMCEVTLRELEKPRWIPVTERLPEKKRASYLCLTDGGYCKQVRWTNSIYGLVESDNWGWSIFDVPQFSHVTHWMPLPPAPEPPKEEA